MGGDGDQRGETGPAESGVSGALSALLEELVRTPAEGAAEPPPLKPGDKVGHFEILHEIGRGGFGVVYEALDPALSRKVALKTLRASRTAHELSADWLRREAEAAARLDHPGLVTLLEAGVAPQGPWLAMELLRGETLEARLARGPLAAREAAAVAREVAAALGHAHSRGVLHRDLKPGNIFLTDDGRVKLLDLGLAHLLGTRAGATAGTPAFMAPEQARGEPVDARADVFSLGATLFQMLAGRPPFALRDGRSSALDGGPAPRLPSGVPPALARLVARMLDADPARRPASGQAAAEELREAERALQRPREASRWALRIGLGVAVGALVALAVSWQAWRRAGAGAGSGGKVTVAVADFANETQDPELDGLSGLLITSLEQSTKLRVLTRSRMFDLLRQLGRPDATRIDEPLAREIGKRAGVKALLLASVRRMGDVYAVEMRALDPVKDEYVFTVREQAEGKRGVLEVIDRLGEQTRRNLQEGEADVRATRRGVAEVTTGDLSAYEHFFHGKQALDLRQFDRAAAELQAAVAADPGFALAHYQIAVLDAWTVKPGSSDARAQGLATAHLETAVKLAGKLPEKERLALLAWKATWEKDYDLALRLRDQAEAAYPQDKEAVFWAGDIRFHRGEVPEAVPYFERALQLDPEYRLVQEHLVLALSWIDRREEEAQWARRWAESSRDPEAWRALGRALLGLGRPDEAGEAFGKAAAADGLYATVTPATAAWMCQAGRCPEAEALLRRALAELKPPPPGAGEGQRTEGLSLRRALLATLAFEGRMKEARRVMDGLEAAGVPAEEVANTRFSFAVLTRALPEARAAMRVLEHGPSWKQAPARFEVAIGLAFAGDGTAARALAADALADPAACDVAQRSRDLYGALLAWRMGEVDRAVERLQALSRSPFVDARHKALAVLGEVELERGRPADAVKAFTAALAIPWSVQVSSRSYFQAPVLLRLAQVLERQGDRAQARERLGQLLAQWQRADADLPELAEARALQRRVNASN